MRVCVCTRKWGGRCGKNVKRRNHPSSFFIFILFACNKNKLHTYYQYTSFIERTTQQRPSSSFLISMALCSRVVVESSSSSMMMRRGAAFNNNHSNKKKIFLSFLLTKRRITRFSGLTNSGSSSFEQRGGEEEENNKDKKDELVIITNDALHYASTMTQKRNEVEEYLQKCDSLELELQLALAAEDYDAASKIKKNLQPENSDEDINFSMLCDLCRRVNQPPTSKIGSSADETETEEITMAARKLGLIGDPRALPALARALRMPTVSAKAKNVSAKAHAQIERSMWTLFGKSGDMELDLLLQKGRDIMHGK